MPKIKNWSKLSGDTWKNDKTGDRVQILTRKNFGTGRKWYEVSGAGIRKEYSSKEDAREDARAWMKSNPKP